MSTGPPGGNPTRKRVVVWITCDCAGSVSPAAKPAAPPVTNKPRFVIMRFRPLPVDAPVKLYRLCGTPQGSRAKQNGPASAGPLFPLLWRSACAVALGPSATAARAVDHPAVARHDPLSGRRAIIA